MVKNPPASAGDAGAKSSSPVSVRSSGEGNDNPLQYSCQEDPVNRGVWWATVLRVARREYNLDLTFLLGGSTIRSVIITIPRMPGNGSGSSTFLSMGNMGTMPASKVVVRTYTEHAPRKLWYFCPFSYEL